MDSPSGTAITLVNDIIDKNNSCEIWTKTKKSNSIHMISKRKNKKIGIHNISFESQFDKITIQHEAFSRDSFAKGSIIAAKWIQNKKGIFNMDDILGLALRVNDFLSGVMFSVGIKLVDFKIEIGRFFEGEYQRLLIADEISPDSCRLWDIKSGEKFDKDVFRRDLGSLTDAYTEVANRLGILPKGNSQTKPKL